MNLKQAKKLRKAAKYGAGPNWKQAYKTYKKEYKKTPVTLLSLKAIHAAIEREKQGADSPTVGTRSDSQAQS